LFDWARAPLLAHAFPILSPCRLFNPKLLKLEHQKERLAERNFCLPVYNAGTLLLIVLRAVFFELEASHFERQAGIELC
jgi:hypothetical protein